MGFRRPSTLAAILLVGCAAPSQQGSPLEPTLGRSQPLPTTSVANPSEADRAPSPEPTAAGPTPGAMVSLESVMVGAIDTPDPDPSRLAQTDAARFHKRDGVAKIGFCVGEDGQTCDIEILVSFPGDPMVDAIFVETIGGWRFKPIVVGGRPIKVCTSHTYRLKFEGQPKPPPQPKPEPEPEPKSEPKVPPPASITAEDELLCGHITGLVLASSKDRTSLSPDQIAELIASCAAALAQDRRKIGEAEYNRRAECVLAATSVEGVAACQPDSK